MRSLAPLSLSLLLLAASTLASPRLFARDMDMDMSHPAHDAPPLLELNETEILQWHAPDPPSYYGHDFLHEGEGARWTGLMGVHVVACSLAYFAFLPLAIALRGAHHPLHAPANAAYLFMTLLAGASGTLYKKLTPNLYEGSLHGSAGLLLLFSSTLLSLVDVWGVLVRVWGFVRGPERSVGRLWGYVVLGKETELHQHQHAYGLVGLEHSPESYALQEHIEEQEQEHDQFLPSPPDSASASSYLHPRASLSSDSHSETTLHENHLHLSPLPSPAPAQARGWRRAAWITFMVVEHVLVVGAAAVSVMGGASYMGWCRAEYVNGCAAHMIKGGIFLFYGILTFSRYLGAFASLGWAWNLPPSSSSSSHSPRRSPPSAEMIESSVIFLYGATNTWMERFGSQPGDPYTTKQIQHISIAVMFAFAGAMGMALESSFVRKMLSASAFSEHARRDEGRGEREEGEGEEEEEGGKKARASYNVFPALCIGITGLAMSAHHQTYLFQVQIHALWGLFLSLYALCRFLTYFFLYLSPPTSALPSRPPTEALAGFCLACGGLTFILSTEQITYAAMRTGRDDVMMVLNLVVGVVCWWFCWCVGVLAVRGWAVRRVEWAAARERSERVDGQEGKEVQA